jgi:hypothetical protein
LRTLRAKFIPSQYFKTVSAVKTALNKAADIFGEANLLN